MQADGRILVGGSGGGSSVDFVLVRFLPDGSLDGSFGQNGITTVDFGRRTDRLADLEIGPLYRSAMGVTRLLEDGTLDEGFGRGGRSIVRFFPGVVEDGTYLNGLAAQTDGSLVFAGSGHPYPSPAVSVFARLRRDGELDERFGSHGRVIPETVPTAERAIDVTIDGVDRIVASVFIEQPSLPYQAGVIRLSPDGAPDATFGSGGLAMVGLPRQTGPGDVVLTGGHLIVGGSVQIGDRRGSDFALFAFQH